MTGLTLLLLLVLALACSIMPSAAQPSYYDSGRSA